MKTMTAIMIIAAIEIGGARSIKDIYLHCGGKTRPGGGAGKKMVGLVPDLMDRIESAKNGNSQIPAAKIKAMEDLKKAHPPTICSAPKPTPKRKTRKVLVKQRKTAVPSAPTKVAKADKFGFRPGSLASTVATMGSRKAWKKDDLISAVSKETGKAAHCVDAVIKWMKIPNHQSNKAKVDHDRKQSEKGLIKIVVCQAAYTGTVRKKKETVSV